MLSLPTQYALKALLVLREEDPSTYIQVQYLSSKSDVPGPYLSKIMKVLVAKGILESRKGAHGGVRFSVERKAVSFFDICIALEDPIVMQRCFMSKGQCNAHKPCSMHSSWGSVQHDLVKSLQKVFVRKTR